MADKAGWHRFNQVTHSVPSGHKLYRASAPNYDEDKYPNDADRSQDLTKPSVDFLVSQGIDSIISFNKYEYSPDMKKILGKIEYKHIKLEDFKPPTLAQLDEANTFFKKHKSTLVHCGYGWGRTGTGVTGLQVFTEDGNNLRPLGSLWTTPLASGGNNVETREQVSILSERRNLLFKKRVTGIPPGNPQQSFAIINFATGHYLALPKEKNKVSSNSPETAEKTSSIEQVYQWVVVKDAQGYYTLSNKTVSTSFALTKAQGAAVNDPVTYGTQTQGNTLFSIKEVSTGDKGRYVISPKPSPTLAVAIEIPKYTGHPPPISQSAELFTKLASSNQSNKFGLWILLPATF